MLDVLTLAANAASLVLVAFFILCLPVIVADVRSWGRDQ